MENNRQNERKNNLCRNLNAKRRLIGLALLIVVCITGCSGGKPQGKYTAETWYQLSFNGDTCVFSNDAYGFAWKGSYTMNGNVILLELTDNGGYAVEKVGIYDKASNTIEMDDKLFIKE